MSGFSATFNMPALDWTENTPMLKTDHTRTCKSVYEYYIDMINDQFVSNG